MDRRTQRTAERIGEQLAAWRKLLDLTSQQTAERAGISRKTLSRLENGENVSFSTFLAVSRALGIADRVTEAVDPWHTDLGRMRAEASIPKRVRHRAD
jgi:transcriptional regulator with XRE-family HTH domain